INVIARPWTLLCEMILDGTLGEVAHRRRRACLDTLGKRIFALIDSAPERHRFLACRGDGPCRITPDRDTLLHPFDAVVEYEGLGTGRGDADAEAGLPVGSVTGDLRAARW